jgi:hypothetical protein
MRILRGISFLVAVCAVCDVFLDVGEEVATGLSKLMSDVALTGDDKGS